MIPLRVSKRLETRPLLGRRHPRCVSWSSVFGERHSEAHARNAVGMWQSEGGGDGTGPEQEEFFGKTRPTF